MIRRLRHFFQFLWVKSDCSHPNHKGRCRIGIRAAWILSGIMHNYSLGELDAGEHLIEADRYQRERGWDI